MREPEFVRLKTAAHTFDVGESTLRRYVSKGVLAAKRIGPRNIRVRPEDVRALLTPVESKS